MAALTTGSATPESWFNCGGFCGGLFNGGCAGTPYGRGAGCCGGCNGCYGSCNGWGGCCGSCAGCYGVYGYSGGCWGCGGCWGSCSGCWGSCSGCCGGSCSGCCGGCWGSCSGCCGGCWGSCSGCSGCWGSCSGCSGCYGGAYTIGTPVITAPVTYGAPGDYSAPSYQGTVPAATTYPTDLHMRTAPTTATTGGERQALAAPARLNIELPADAKLYVDGQLTISTTETRIFHHASTAKRPDLFLRPEGGDFARRFDAHGK